MLNLCKEIVVFLILAKMLESFQAGEKYGKFLKLIISLIVVLKLITPVFSLFNSEFDFENVVSEMEKRLLVENESIEGIQEDIELVKKIEISEMKVNVEEIQWEK